MTPILELQREGAFGDAEIVDLPASMYPPDFNHVVDDSPDPVVDASPVPVHNAELADAIAARERAERRYGEMLARFTSQVQETWSLMREARGGHGQPLTWLARAPPSLQSSHT
ncbi:hypothetical protein PFICI_00862 [Pestalotiopsis fici W106-1]|uniref:Uncharacterized protein n=1 Tax=Pestalotiopsis fici (strain W106-1 / CGMCC3.15140) TaxID=1229662 RepID=W3XM12_PESFW|nr:uncharacterized protein PFICI_00862 [Pestalotiopsis fici W106-1]ETS87034.1 hypothetical protein PFICI_00862 [Pestalotiopsis fici W106-1]